MQTSKYPIQARGNTVPLVYALYSLHRHVHARPAWTRRCSAEAESDTQSRRTSESHSILRSMSPLGVMWILNLLLSGRTEAPDPDWIVAFLVEATSSVTCQDHESHAVGLHLIPCAVGILLG